jgi:CheY-like chemotaxis protein
VIVNLSVNARDAMPDGGRVVITTANVELDEEQARRQLVAPGVYVLLQVTDTGVGMDEAVRGRIFEPFFTTKELGQGTGLGLATVYGIVKQSGGHITVESRRGEGSVFSVYLPRTEGAVEAAPRVPAGGAPGGRESILLVEDEEAVRALVARYLRQLGYRVLEASDGPQALAVVAAARSVDLLLTDMVMPRLGGAELAARLRAERPGLPVLFVSGHSDQAQGLLQSGALGKGVAFLQKPYSTDELARRLRELLDE